MAWYTAANVMLSNVKAATSAAMESLNAMQETLDNAISAGLEAENTAIENAEMNIVSAVEAHSMTYSTASAQSDAMEADLLEALRTALEQLNRSSMVAEHNKHVAANFGPENISHVTNTTAGLQAATVLPRESAAPGEGSPGATEGTGQQASVDYLVETAQARQKAYLGEILTEQQDNSDFLVISGLFQSNIGAGFLDTVVSEGVMEEAIATRRFSAVPSGLHAGLREIDLKGNDHSGYSRIVQRSRAAAAFLAWDLAIRSEIPTSEGSTSLLHFVQTSVEQVYGSTDGMVADGTANSRELINSMATNQAISNLLDMLIMELGGYQNNLEAAKLGYYNDEASNPVTGYNDTGSALDSIER